jgi:hypothetical protein
VGIPVLLVVATLVFGTVGFRRFYQDNEGKPASVGEAVWLATGLPLGETTNNPSPGARLNGWLQAGRVAGYMVLLYAFAVLAADSLRPGWMRLRAWAWSRLSSRDYAVVCGLGWRGQEITLDLARMGSRVSVLDNAAANPFVEDVAGSGVQVFQRGATSQAALAAACVRRANRVFVVAASETAEESSDELNCRIVQQIVQASGQHEMAPCRSFLAQFPPSGPADDEARSGWVARLAELCSTCPHGGGRNAPCQVYMHAETPSVRHFLEDATRESAVTVKCFNTHESTARQLLARCPLFLRPEAGGTRHVHLVVLGDSPMARALVLRLLQTMHLREGRQVLLSVAVPDVERAKAYWYERFTCLDPAEWRADPQLATVAKPLFERLRFHPLPEAPDRLVSPAFPLFEKVGEADWSTQAFFCLDDGVFSFVALDQCRRALTKLGAERVGLFHYYNYPEGETSAGEGLGLLQPTGDGRLPVVHFGSFLEMCSVDVIEDGPSRRLAQAIYAAYSKGDDADPPKTDNANLLVVLPRNCARDAGDLNRWLETGAFAESHPVLSPGQSACLIDELWDHLAEWERDSNVECADHLWVKLQEMGIDVRQERTSDALLDSGLRNRIVGLLQNEKLRVELAVTEHRRWCAERLLAGWRPMPEGVPPESRKLQKDAWRRHWDLVLFEKLPDGEDRKDHIPVLGIPSHLQQAGFFGKA